MFSGKEGGKLCSLGPPKQVLYLWQWYDHHYLSAFLSVSQLLVVTFLWTQRDHDMWHLTFRPWLGRRTKIWRLNRMLRIQPSPLDNWITNGNTYMNKRKRPAQIRLHSKRPHTITKMNDRLSLDSTITGSMKAHSKQITSLECRVYYSLTMNIARLILTLFLSAWFPTDFY